MKILVNIIRFFVGILFIFSGLVKANDPTGLSYKMQEFFSLWHVGFLNDFSLWLSVLMVAFEIIAGAALLLGWKPKSVSWLLLILIVFFTALTGYAYLSGKFKSCGCFGDCIPITSGQSFFKDVVLLILILIIFYNQRYIKPILPKYITLALLVLVSLFSFASQWYTLRYLPYQDCLPYKVGNNITSQMQMPANAVPDQTEIRFIYKKDGKEVEFTADNFPSDFNDTTYTFVNRYDKVIKAGSNNIPPITNFALINISGIDIANNILGMNRVALLFMESNKTNLSEWEEGFSKIAEVAGQKNIPIYIVSNNRKATMEFINKTLFKNIEILEGDHVMINTAARANPTLVMLQNGTITNKWSFAAFDKALSVIEK